jgi:3'(2'),5'-bisphosphate nucleotidase
VPTVGETFFLVDPLDGTREFIHRRGEFTINVALIAGGVPVFGLVYAPALGEFYLTTAIDAAAAADVKPCGGATTLADLALRPISARVPDPAALVALASRSHMTPETEAFLAQYSVASYRQAGSSLKFCAIACGEADIYPRLGPTCEWDTAAGHAVLAAAGGSVTTVDGAALTYGKGDPRWLNPHFIAWGRGGVLAPRKAGVAGG